MMSPFMCMYIYLCILKKRKLLCDEKDNKEVSDETVALLVCMHNKEKEALGFETLQQTASNRIMYLSV